MTSHRSTTTPTPPMDAGRLGISREELAELERELDAYLAFWACARDGRPDGTVGWERR
jgi:hypothetical protein